MVKRSILILLYLFINYEVLSIETAALKASIINCYGFSDQLSGYELINNNKIQSLKTTLYYYLQKETFKGFDKRQYILEGRKLALSALEKGDFKFINSMLLGCSENIKSFKYE